MGFQLLCECFNFYFLINHFSFKKKAALPVARTAARTASRTAAQTATRIATRTGARALARGAPAFSPTAAVASKILAVATVAFVAAAPYLLSFVTVFQL